MSLKPLSYRAVKRRLEVAGFVEHSQTGSNAKFVKRTPEGVFTAIVPHHLQVAGGALRSILRQAGLTMDEFEAP